MSEWTATDLAAIDRDGELHVAADRPDGTRRAPTIVWHVVIGGHLFIRSVRGDDGAWYRAVRRTWAGTIEAGGVRADVSFVRDDTHDEAIDRAYHDKYGDGSPVRAITSAAARATTLRVDRQ
jgi:hypothetical protein